MWVFSVAESENKIRLHICIYFCSVKFASRFRAESKQNAANHDNYTVLSMVGRITL